MSIYTVNGSPVMHDGKFLTTGGTHELPEYDSEDANKVLKVSPNGHSIDWYDDANTTYTAGNGLTLNGTEFSADTTVLATQSDLSGKQDKLTAGQNITIDADNVISATGGGSSYTAGNGIDITGDEISVDTSVVATQTDLSGKQDTLTAGQNIQINNDVISATDTTYTAGTGLSLTGTEFSADTTVLATQQDLSGKQNALTAGSNIQINGTTISATDTTYSAGTGLSLNGTTFSVDDPLPAHTSSDEGKVLTVNSQGVTEWAEKGEIDLFYVTYNVTTYDEIKAAHDAGKWPVLIDSNGRVAPMVDYDWIGTAAPSIQNASFVVRVYDYHSDTDGADYYNIVYNLELHVDQNLNRTETWSTTSNNSSADWNAVTGPRVIRNKPTIPTVDQTYSSASANAQSGIAVAEAIATKQDVLTAGSNITISNNVISATDTTYTAGSNITISGGVISAASQVQADYSQSDSNAVDYIKNKPTIPTATSDLNNDSGFITSSDVPSAQVQSDWNETNSSSAAYIVNKPTIPTVPTTDQTYNSSSTNPQSGTAVAGALATVTLSTLNTAGITDIQQVASLPANPVATVLYLIPET